MTSEAQELYANQTPSSDAQSESDALINEEEPINEAPAIEERVVSDVPVSLRRSNRSKHAPNKLQDYYCDMVVGSQGSSPHTLSKVISICNLTPSHGAFTIEVSVQRVNVSIEI
nr:uncharacterized protein LOC109147362 [Ipomoea trifida]